MRFDALLEVEDDETWIDVWRCPRNERDHIITFDGPLIEVNCPHCFRSGHGEQKCKRVLRYSTLR